METLREIRSIFDLTSRNLDDFLEIRMIFDLILIVTLEKSVGTEI